MKMNGEPDWQWGIEQTYIKMAGREHFTLNDAALFLGPGLPVGVGRTGALLDLGLRATGRHSPAVAKIQSIDNTSLASGGEVIHGVSIIVTT